MELFFISISAVIIAFVLLICLCCLCKKRKRKFRSESESFIYKAGYKRDLLPSYLETITEMTSVMEASERYNISRTNTLKNILRKK